MAFVLIGSIGGAVLFVVSALVWLVVRWRSIRTPGSGRGWRFVRRAVIGLVLLSAVSGLVVTPLVLGQLAVRMIGTRPFERDYAGPRLGDDGAWMLQDRRTIRAEQRGQREVPPGVAEAAAERAVAIEATDGVTVRGWFVPYHGEARFAVACVHGLFRSGVELEPVGNMFRELGGDVLLVELRNHGGSDRSPPGFGAHEKHDVHGALRWLAERSHEGLPLLVFGVSLGSAAVTYAIPEFEDALQARVAGVVLDSPMPDIGRAATRRMRDFIPWPARPIFLRSLENACGVRLAEVRPIEALARFPDRLAVMVVAGEEDEYVSPEQVREFAAQVPGEVAGGGPWIAEGVDHGHVWLQRRAEYVERLDAFVEGCLQTGGRPR